MKLGKHPARIDPRTLKLARFLSDTAPAAPDAMDWFSGITSWGMMRNDTVGDCTCAAMGHIRQSQSAALGTEYTVGDDVVISAYSAITGYDPSQTRPDGSNPTDNGANELDVLNWVRKNGFGGKQLLAYADPAISNFDHIRKAVYLFNGLYIGLQLPMTAQGQKTWDVVLNSNDNQPGSWGGHAVPILGYDADTLTVVTWGELQQMTWNFFKTYCDEAHALLWGDWADFGAKDFKLGELQSELALVTG